MRYRSLLILLLASFSSLLTAAAPDQSISSATSLKSRPASTINIAIDLWPGYYPVIIARQLGLFAQRGLTVNISYPQNTDLMLKQFAAHELDAVCVAAGDLVLGHRDNLAARIVMISDLSAGGDALLSLERLPNTLNGLRIGTNMGGFGELFVEQFVSDYGSDVADVKLLNLDASQAYEKLASGELDIAHSWEPYVSEAKSRGAKVVYTSRQTPGLIPDILAFNGEFIQQHPQQVRLFIEAWLEAVDWWLSNTEQGNLLVMKALQLDSPISLEGIRLMDRESNVASFNGQSARALPAVIRRYINLFVRRGYIDTSFPVDEIIDARFIQASPAPP